MPNPPPPDDAHAVAPSRGELRHELTRRGLPPAYIERLIAELDDHYVDLLEERNSPMGAARKPQFEESGANDLQQRLGEPTQLALFATAQYHNRSFWGRHPVVTFVLAPLPLLVLCWIATGLGVTGTGKAIAYICEHWFGLSDSNIHPGDHLVAQAGMMVAVSWLLIVVPPLAVAWLLCRIAARNTLNWRWPIASCVPLAFVAGCLAVSYRLAVQPHEGQLMVGLGFALSPQWLLLVFLPKFAVAMAIGLLLIAGTRQRAAMAT